MSSYIRRLERQVVPSRAKIVTRNRITGVLLSIEPRPARYKFYGKSLFNGGRGSRLGIPTNPKCACKIARERREAARRG